MSFKIVTDSSCNLTEEIIDQYDIEILPLLFRVGDDEYYSYLKGEKTDLRQFYTMMRNGDVITTSLINLETCDRVFRGLLDEGNDILYIGFSSALSGTYEAASHRLDELKAEYPDRTLLHIDSLAASLGEGLLIDYAAKLRNKGNEIESVYDWLLENRLHLCHWFTVDDLMFLHRGGRVSKTAAIAGTVLGIKPIMHVDDTGHLTLVGKARSRRKSLDTLVNRMDETAIEPVSEQTVFITHGDCIEDAEYVANRIRERFGVTDILINYVDPVIGAHSGPGTLALFFLGDHR